MPIREYVCSKCNSNEVKELLVSLNEVPNCDTCNSPLKQVITEGPAGYVKGSHTPCAKDYK